MIGLAFLATALTMFTSPASPTTSIRPVTGQQVTLKAPPASNTVQMFESIDNANSPVIGVFANGTQCKKLDGPSPANEPGPPMYFYKLVCDGMMGYVNVQWVNE